MKKALCVLLCLALSFSFAACQNKKSDNSSESAISSSGEAKLTSSKTNTEPDKNILVAYYSATGSTKAVANIIAETLGADIFEITPVDPYTSEDLNWNDEGSRVSVEHNEESKRTVPLVKAVPDNWEKYDTVYIGYPIWWGIAAWPVNGFVSANDFTAKTVIPFCTSASSGFGESGRQLSKITGTGNWLGGKRFSSNASEKEVTEWLESLAV